MKPSATKTRGVRAERATKTRGVKAERAMLVGLLVILTVVGMVMVLSASSVESILRYGSPWSVFERQLLWVAIGVVAFVLASRIRVEAWQRFTPVLIVMSCVLLLMVLVPGVGLHAEGSSRWVGVGPLKLQPSELAKLAFVLFAAHLLSRRPEQIGSWRHCLRPFVIVLSVMAVLILKQPDMGTAMILVITGLGMLYLAGIPSRQLAVFSTVVVAAAIGFGLSAPYRRERLTSFLHPFASRDNAGYQVVQSLSALGSGHIWGVGLGASRAKWGFLPNSYTDFIFSVIGEELGVVGALVVVGLFAALAIVGIRVARRAPDRFSALMVGGVTCWVVGQAIVNMGTVVGLMPVTGVPLPFISYGGSSLVIMMIAMGIVVNVAGRLVEPEGGSVDPAARSSGRGASRRAAPSSVPVRRAPSRGHSPTSRSPRPAHVGRNARRASVAARHPSHNRRF